MAQRIDIINALFGGPGRTAVLRLLASRTTPLTGRQVAGLTGLSQPGAARALEHLAGLGVVSRRAAGRAILHALERENILVQSIVLPVLAAEQSLTEDLTSALAETFGPFSVNVTLFGSIVAGDAGPESDIDVLVVTAGADQSARALQAYDDAGLRFFRRYGMPLSVIVTARDQLPSHPSAFWTEARDNGITVSGVPLRELL